jgi:hypothetical protein
MTSQDSQAQTLTPAQREALELLAQDGAVLIATAAGQRTHLIQAPGVSREVSRYVSISLTEADYIAYARPHGPVRQFHARGEEWEITEAGRAAIAPTQPVLREQVGNYYLVKHADWYGIVHVNGLEKERWTPNKAAAIDTAKKRTEREGKPLAFNASDKVRAMFPHYFVADPEPYVLDILARAARHAGKRQIGMVHIRKASQERRLLQANPLEV